MPDFFNPTRADKAWHVPYETRAQQAAEWAPSAALTPAAADTRRIWLLLVDVQNTFCMPDFELFVAGRSGRGAVEDTIRLCQFIYGNLGSSRRSRPPWIPTGQQIFHAIFLVDEAGAHPAPYTTISAQDVRSGKWKFNPALAGFGISPEYGQKMMMHYVTELEKHGKYELTIWPYHAMLGGVGHALVSAVEEAVFFHSMARLRRPSSRSRAAAPSPSITR